MILGFVMALVIFGFKLVDRTEVAPATVSPVPSAPPPMRLGDPYPFPYPGTISPECKDRSI